MVYTDIPEPESIQFESRHEFNREDKIDSAMLGAAAGPALQKSRYFQSGNSENNSGVGEMDEKSVDSDDKKPTARKHNTRGRNGIKKQRIEIYSPGDSSDRNSEESFINICASALASIDRRACARALLKDANAILEEIVLPMSFPWAHTTAPFMRIPRDIEDMPGIIGVGYSYPVSDIYGKFEYLNTRRYSETTKAAVRRGCDPGVVELTTISDLSQPRRRSFLPYIRSSDYEGLIDTPGERSLQLFDEVQYRNGMRNEIHDCNLKRRSVSIRVGCTSSRSTILDDSGYGRTPLILPALLPREVQEGKRKRGRQAFEQAKDLGSYNCRQGQTLSACSSAIRPRAWVGRTRLIWSEQEQPMGASQRGHFRSILTGERLESIVQKRPLQVKVGIQVGGVLLSTGKSTMKKNSTTLDSVLSSTDPGHQFSYAGKVVNESLDRNFAGAPDLRDHSQCHLRIERFFSNIKDDFKSEHKSRFVNQVIKPLKVDVRLDSGHDFHLTMKPPRLDCTTTEDGIIAVSCSIPGEFRWQGVASFSTERVIMDTICTQLKVCQVCFTSFEPLQGNSHIGLCSSCKSFVDDGCASSKTKSSQFRSCEAGSEMIKYTKVNELCAICGLDCSVVVWDEELKDWYHDVCRIWAGVAGGLRGDKDFSGVCHLCSTGSSSVVRCASEKCEVRFHPLCAVFASKAAASQRHRFVGNDVHEQDAFLCTQYELSMLQTSYPTDNDPVFGKTAVVPVAFCGYHNPKRRSDHFSLYPGCCYLENAIRIPPRREGRH